MTINQARRPHVIVLGNEKGGSGKSTTAMHVVISLCRDGKRVGTIDLDARQRTLTRYIENRQAFSSAKNLPLPMPTAYVVEPSQAADHAQARIDEQARFETALEDLSRSHDVIVIDSPGADSFLSRLGHSYADTLITPMNDSFIDLDLLARVDADSLKVKGPSLYSAMVWEQRQQRVRRDQGKIDWIVMRNRLSNLDAKNKQRVGQVLNDLSRRIGFRLAPGLSERVIFRELFLVGLTLLDLKGKGTGIGLTMSHVAARQELQSVLEALQLPK